jgi:hypothetical protein
MRTFIVWSAALALVVATGCSNKPSGSVAQNTDSPSRSQPAKKLIRTVEEADDATEKRVMTAVATYLDKKAGLFNIVPVKVAKPIPTHAGKAEAVWVQFKADNSQGEKEYHDHDLFIIFGDGKVLQCRTAREIEYHMGPEWLRKNPTPPWDLLPQDKGK